MKKINLVYCLTLVVLLTSCGAKDLDKDSNSTADNTTTLESVTNNETISSTTVKKMVESLTAEQNTIELEVGETVQLTYSILPEKLDANVLKQQEEKEESKKKSYATGKLGANKSNEEKP